MKRIVLAAAVGLFSLVALAAQSGQGFTATINVGAGIGTVQSPDVFLAGDEVIVSIPYDSKGTWDCSVFSPPNGDAFKILARGGMQAGKGTLLFGVPAASFSKVFEITAILDFNSQRGTVYIQLKSGVTGLRKAAIPAALASMVIRAGAPQVTQASDAAKPPFVATANVPADMATIGTMVMFSTGTEAVFSIPYDSKGDWDVSFFDPPNGDHFKLVARPGLRSGKGTTTFAVPLEKMVGVKEATCIIDFSGRRATIFFRILQDLATLKPSLIPAELAVGVIRTSTVAQTQQQPNKVDVAGEEKQPDDEPLIAVSSPQDTNPDAPLVSVIGVNHDGRLVGHWTGVSWTNDWTFRVDGTGLYTQSGIYQEFDWTTAGDMTLMIPVMNSSVTGAKNDPTYRFSNGHLFLKKYNGAKKSWFEDEYTLIKDVKVESLAKDLPDTNSSPKPAPVSNHDQRLLGRWKTDVMGAQYTFFADGTASYVEIGLRVQDKITWMTTAGKTLTTTNNSPGANGKPYSKAYEIKDGHLFIYEVSTSVTGQKTNVVSEYVPFP